MDWLDGNPEFCLTSRTFLKVRLISGFKASFWRLSATTARIEVRSDACFDTDTFST